MDPRVERMAGVLVNYGVGVKPDDLVLIQSSTLGVPLVDACFKAVLEAGGNPATHIGSEEFRETLLRYGNDEQLSFIDPMTNVAIQEVDCSIGLIAPANTRATANADPSRMALANKAMERLMETFMQRTADGSLRWTVAAYPTNAGAQDAGM